ncbi:uncharacterized protein K489DRAFT_388183 [Dissoconium aciculare CBS 342.82]|uniref:Uncharacterized protein n=1 Tax=Dissoconium aciculare CBS 342.82 TaxID=1314786 RepID=A0A6J3M5L7_9PEZI|nr:uncharacterized protein K489DRAFT_388183 [Dissoconium aciculare CBS 342.82]KAF1823356.1 hypothetical protein K489DRAFT_388183 [Dissoconium aciculare CBS 342.82]
MAFQDRRPPASFLSLPSELRNAIYTYLFDPAYSTTEADLSSPPSEPPNAPSTEPSRPDLRPSCAVESNNQRSSHALRVLQTCKQMHHEARLLALTHLPFHVRGETALPETFSVRSARLPRDRLRAVRTLTLTARISHLRAMNEAWGGVPFGAPELRLDALVIVPSRPDVTDLPFREIADLSQSHTLAYVLGETLKGLRNVGYVEVRNHGCFDGAVWEKLYCGVVYRLWRWGGGKCGIRFASGRAEEPGRAAEENRWFRAYLKDEKGDEGVEVGVEVCRLVGTSGQFPFDPSIDPRTDM